MQAGDIGFLTIRKNKPIYRIVISYMIALLTKLPKEKIKDTKVHSFVIYEKDNKKFIRDMDKEGDTHYSLEDYLEIYGDRVEIRKLPYYAEGSRLSLFNKSCANTKVKYDYMNTFVYQLIRSLGGRLLFKKTIYTRMCAEDVQRQLNIIRYIFDTPEITNPAELDKLTRGWETLYNNKTI